MSDRSKHFCGWALPANTGILLRRIGAHNEEVVAGVDPTVASPGGELDIARAAARHGLPFTLSTLATRSIEEVAACSNGPKWLQVYVWRDRGLVKDMLARADQAGYEAIAITVDTAVLGRRERDTRNGFTMPPQLSLGTLLDGAGRVMLLNRAMRALVDRRDGVVLAAGSRRPTAVTRAGWKR